MINGLLSNLQPFHRNCIYKLIAYQNLKLCVDIGAAAGMLTQQIRKAGDEFTNIIAFEPFEGNYPHFLRNTRTFSHQVQLIKKAVSNQTITTTLYVPSVVQGTEKNWENYPGYSSVGYVEGSHNPTPISSTGKTLTVETTTIDEEIGQQHIDFMKIDVQGHEHKVLQGCQTLLNTGEIDVLYIEFDGDQQILDLLEECRYIIFDTGYTVILRPELKVSDLRQFGFDLHAATPAALSTGAIAVETRLNLPHGENYCQFFSRCRQECGYLWTDLIAVSPRFIDRFMINLGKWLSGLPPRAFSPAISRQQYPTYWGDRC